MVKRTSGDIQAQWELPMGQRYHQALTQGGPDHAEAIARREGGMDILRAVTTVETEESVPAFLHSALCAMSLPTKRPADDMAPILREDGCYTLAITPKPVMQFEAGKPVMRSLGVPFGSYPRVTLIFIMSQAVKNGSRSIFLGKNFSEWIRRLGYPRLSHGRNGGASLLREQLDRLMACEWMIRWDKDEKGGSAFAVKEVKLASEYSGLMDSDGRFIRELHLAEDFYSHLREHAVPLNEMAIRELKNQPIALDLYTYLAYRLPRIGGDRPVTMSWEQLRKHLGSSAEIRRFRQQVRQTSHLVSGVYPQMRADFSGPLIRLYTSPAPLERRHVGGHLRAIASPVAKLDNCRPFRSADKVAVRPLTLEPPPTKVTVFPKGSLHFGEDEKPFLKIAKDDGAPWDVDMIAQAYRNYLGDSLSELSGTRLMSSWKGFCESFAKKRRAKSLVD